jgi:hypothetical protein
MKGRFWTTALLGLSLLLVGCAAPNPGPEDDASVPIGPPSPTTEPAPRVTSADDVQRIGPVEASLRADAGQAVLVDTRSADSYASQHAAGAISLPESQATARLSELPTDRDLIFY